MISAYLLYKRMFNTAEKAIEFFSSKRVKPGTQVCLSFMTFHMISLTINLAVFFIVTTLTLLFSRRVAMGDHRPAGRVPVTGCAPNA